MAKDVSGFSKKPVFKRKNIIKQCDYINLECSCTNLNGPGCKKKQEDGKCDQINNGPKKRQQQQSVPLEEKKIA